MEFTERHELFCREYVKDRNAAQAYIRAGYTRGAAAYKGAQRLMDDPQIQARIEELTKERDQELKLEAREIIEEALAIVQCDPLRYVDEQGKVLNIAEMPAVARKAIRKLTVKTTGTAVLETVVEFWDKTKAIELLGKHLTLFKESLKVEGMEDIAGRILEARRRLRENPDAAAESQEDDLA